MKIEGSHALSVPREKVWRMLQDPGVLAEVTPGVQRLERIGPDRYQASLKLGIGPIRGTFDGHLEIRDKAEPESMTLLVEGSGGPGGVRAQGLLTLEAQGERTIIHYQGDPQISGRMAAVGGRLISGVAKKLVGQFFTDLERAAASYPSEADEEQE